MDTVKLDRIWNSEDNDLILEPFISLDTPQCIKEENKINLACACTCTCQCVCPCTCTCTNV